MSNFAQRLIEIRKEKGMTQEQLGALLSISRQAVGHWESGRSVPDVDTIRHIADALGCKIEDLIPMAASLDPVVAPPISDTPEPDAAPLPSAPAPQAAPAKNRLHLLLSLVAVLLVGCLIGLLVGQMALPQDAVKNLFRAQLPKAQLYITAEPNPVYLENSDLFDGAEGYVFDLIVSNESDVPFAFEKVYLLYYVDEEIFMKFNISGEDLESFFGSDMLTRDSYPVRLPTASNQLKCTHAVFVAEGTDANGNARRFECKVEFIPEYATND